MSRGLTYSGNFTYNTNYLPTPSQPTGNRLAMSNYIQITIKMIHRSTVLVWNTFSHSFTYVCVNIFFKWTQILNIIKSNEHMLERCTFDTLAWHFCPCGFRLTDIQTILHFYFLYEHVDGNQKVVMNKIKKLNFFDSTCNNHIRLWSSGLTCNWFIFNVLIAYKVD